MLFSLYHNYSQTDISAAITTCGLVESLCNGEFLLSPDNIACLVVPGRDCTKSHFPRPSRFCWVPTNWQAISSDPNSWFPQYLRDTLLCRRVPAYLFVLTSSVSDSAVFVGEIQLANHGDAPGGLKSALFNLRPQLSKGIWKQIGLFDECLMRINQDRTDITDDNSFREAILKLRQLEYAEVLLTRYEEDTLLVLTHDDLAVLYYYERNWRNGRISSSQKTIEPNVVYDFLMANEESARVSGKHVVSIEQACRVIESFYFTGVLPDSIAWEPCR